MRKLNLIFVLFFIGILLVGCNWFSKEVTISSIEVVGAEEEFDDSFQLADIKIKVIMSDGTSELIPLTLDMLTEEDLSKFNQLGKHTLSVNYQNLSTSFEITITGEKGEKGEDGREIELQVDNEYIYWRYVGDSNWTSLIALSSLVGESGTDGKEITIDIFDGYIKWKYIGEDIWSDIISTDELKGINGREIELQVIEDYICWRYLGDSDWINLLPISILKGESGDNGNNGKEVTLEVIDNYIKWKYVGETSWNNLIALDLLKGVNGTNGREVTFQVFEGKLQWKYNGDSTWSDLFDLNSLKGTDGFTPTIDISDDGFWVINGEKTTHKAVNEIVNEFCTITFDLDGGLLPDGFDSIVTVEKGDSLILPIPTKNLYFFKGWFTGDSVNDFQFNNYIPISRDMTLHAKWEEDPNALYNFLESTRSVNFTTRITNLIYEKQGNVATSSIYTLEEKVYSQYSNINQYNQHTLQTYINDVLDKDNTWEDYKMYKNGMEYRLDNQESQRFSLSNNSYKPYFDLKDIFNPNNFVKTSDTNFIYEYQIDYEIYDYLGWPSDLTPYLYPTSRIYVDLLEQKLIVKVSMVKNTLTEYHEYNQYMEIFISDIGSTTFEYPVDTCKTTVLSQIDEAVEKREETEYATQESLTLFNNIVTTYKTSINSLTSFSEIASSYQLSINDINTFVFEIDELKEHKFNIKTLMEEELNNLKTYATSNSILGMEAVYNSYITLVDNSLTILDVDSNYNNYKIDLNNAYVLDESLIIGGIKESALNKLSDIIFINNTNLENELDGTYYWNVYNNYETEINNATSIATVNALYNDALNSLIALDYPYNDILFRNYMLDRLYPLKKMFTNIEGRVGEFSASVYQLFDDYKLLFNATENVIEIELLYEEAYNSLSIIILSELKAKGQIELTKMYNIYTGYVMDSMLDELNTLYLEYQDLINQETYFRNIIDLLSDFQNTVYNYDFDSLKYLRNVNILYIEQVLAEYRRTATPESIIAMENIVVTYRDIILSAVDTSLISTYYQSAIDELDLAYVSDSSKLEFNRTKGNLLNEMLLYIYQTNYYLVYSSENLVLQDNYDLYYKRFLNSSSISEIEALYTEWYNQFLVGITLDEVKTNELKNTFLGEINFKYNNMISQISNLPVDFESTYNNYYSLISSASNFILAEEIYLVTMAYLDEVQLETYRERTLYSMSTDYDYLIQVLIDSDIVILNTKYTNYVELINNATRIYDIGNYYDYYCSEIAYLTKDDVKEEIYYGLYELNYYFESSKQTATPESIIDMQIVYNDYVLIIKSSTTVTEVQTNVDNAFNAIDDVYVPLI